MEWNGMEWRKHSKKKKNNGHSHAQAQAHTRIRDRTTISFTGTYRTKNFSLPSCFLRITHLQVSPHATNQSSFSLITTMYKKIRFDSSRLVSPLTSWSKLRTVSFYHLLSYHTHTHTHTIYRYSLHRTRKQAHILHKMTATHRSIDPFIYLSIHLFRFDCT